MEPFFAIFRLSPGDDNFATGGVAAAGRAVKNTDLTHPLEELPQVYHNAEQGDSKRTKTTCKQGVRRVNDLGTV